VNLQIYKLRAQFNQAVRQFFVQRHVTEVETPLLARATVTAPHIDSFATTWHSASAVAQTLYLQTSPEYAMKRLLAAGSGDIFQICKAFRDENCGQYHNPEFSMLEWYRVGYDLPAFMEEVNHLIAHIQHKFKIGSAALIPAYFSYQELFLRYAEIDPFDISVQQLQHYAFARGLKIEDPKLTHDDWLSLIQTHVIEPQFQDNSLVFIYDFPATQAALAQLNSNDPRKARRFECYLGGIELANGYDEEANAAELSKRFTEDNVMRQKLGKVTLPHDRAFLAAMQRGLPACIGAALGLDRLFMWAVDCHSIQEVLVFTTECS